MSFSGCDAHGTDPAAHGHGVCGTRLTPTFYALGTLTTLLSFVVVGIYLLLLTSSQQRSQRLVDDGALLETA